MKLSALHLPCPAANGADVRWPGGVFIGLHWWLSIVVSCVSCWLGYSLCLRKALEGQDCLTNCSMLLNERLEKCAICCWGMLFQDWVAMEPVWAIWYVMQTCIRNQDVYRSVRFCWIIWSWCFAQDAIEVVFRRWHGCWTPVDEFPRLFSGFCKMAGMNSSGRGTRYLQHLQGEEWGPSAHFRKM